MWKYSSKNDYPNIILHDCKINSAKFDNKTLTLTFDDMGFWVNKDNKENSFNEILRTDKSQIEFLNINSDFCNIYLFKRISLFRKCFLTIRKKISLDYFCSRLNNGKWQFEFKDETYGGGLSIFNGCLWNGHKYISDCQLELVYDYMNYFWNKMYEDRTW